MTIAFIYTYTPFSLMQNYAITMLLNIILLDLYLGNGVELDRMLSLRNTYCSQRGSTNHNCM